MTGLKRAFYAFWSALGPKAYLKDDVPKDAQLPYTTYEVSLSDFNGESVQTAFVWCPREAPYGNAWRTEMMDMIEEAIPIKGRALPVDGGFVILYRNTSDFLRDWQDPEDANVLGIRVSYTVQHYHI